MRFCRLRLFLLRGAEHAFEALPPKLHDDRRAGHAAEKQLNEHAAAPRIEVRIHAGLGYPDEIQGDEHYTFFHGISVTVRAHSNIPQAPLQPRSRCGCAVCGIICALPNVYSSVINRQFLHAIVATACAGVALSCSSPNNPGPIVVDLVVQSVSPTTGPATGGTELTIRGTGFAAGAAVTVGGRPATEIAVRGADTITAKTPASTIAGAVDIAVTSNGRTSTLAAGFRYDVTINTAPVVKSIVAQGRRLREPANFADYGETIIVTATSHHTGPCQLSPSAGNASSHTRRNATNAPAFTAAAIYAVVGVGAPS